MSLLSDYRLYTSGNEAHPTYHLFCSLVAVSSVVSRRVWIDMDYFSIFPNLYVVLVGPAGNRKSSAMWTMRKFLREVGSVPLSAECVSKEKLVLDMVDEERVADGLPPNKRTYSPMTVCVTELSEFLSISAAGMIGFLTDVYDQDIYEHKTKNRGVATIVGPYLNLLACTTPEWITTYLRTDIISGGFSRRTLFVYETEKSARIPFPEITPAMHAAWKRAVIHAQKLLNVRGAFSWSPEAKDFYADWYVKLKIPTDENVVGYFDTKHIQLLKIAMLIALSEDENNLTLLPRHLTAALDFLALIETNISRVFQGMGRNLLNAAATKVLDLIRHSGTTKFKDLQGNLQEGYAIPLRRLQAAVFKEIDQDDFKKVIEHLVQTDKIYIASFKTKSEEPVREYVILKEH